MTDNASVERDIRSSTFIMVYEDVWQALLCDPTALVVFMAITRRTHEGNRSWYGKKKTLAAEAGVSVATFERKVKVLEERGLVTVTRQYRNPETNEISKTKGGGFTEQIQNIYTVSEHTPEWYESIASSVGVTSERGGVTSQRGDMSPHEEVGVTSQRGPNIDPLHTSQTHTPNERGASAPVADAPAPKKKSRKKPALPLPEGWTPAERTVQAMAEECPTVNQEKELLAFRDHWWSKDERRASWDFTYRNWIRRSAKWSQTPHGNPSQRRSSNDLHDWLPPTQPTTAQLTYDADLLNANVIDHQEDYQ